MTELRRNDGWIDRAKVKTVQRVPNACAADLVSVWADAGRRTLKDAANSLIAASAWPVGMTKIGEIFQTHVQTVENIPRAPEVEGIKELPATELAEGLPRNQCPWCGLTLRGSTSVHRKFCMKMPIRMWLARQRATSRSYNESGNERPCSHCGSVYSEAYARARHEKQCGDRFGALGMEKIMEFSFPQLGPTRASVKKSDSSMQQNTQGHADLDQHNRLSSVPHTSHSQHCSDFVTCSG